MNSSWKTSLTGFAVLALQLAAIFKPSHAEHLQQAAAAIGGLGLLAARDNNVTSEQAGAKKV